MAGAELDRPGLRAHPRSRGRPATVRSFVTVAISAASLLLLVVYNWSNRMPADRFLVKSSEPGLRVMRGTQLDMVQGKPRELHARAGPSVLMVTAVPSGCMNSAWGAATVAKVVKNHADYARMHHYDVWVTYDDLDPDLPPEWNKIQLLTKVLEAYKFQYDWIWWLDQETVITDLAFAIPFGKYSAEVGLVLGPSEDWFVYNEPSHGNINLGTFLLRNNFWSKKLAEHMLAARAEALREDTETYSAIRETIRGMPGVTDQAVLLYLLFGSRMHESEKRRVFFETLGFGGLEGSWKEACSKLGSGQRRSALPGDGQEPPFVVHFGGCRFCRADGDPVSPACRAHFTKAFNFADNQVLEVLGLRHMESASSSGLQDLPQPGKD